MLKTLRRLFLTQWHKAASFGTLASCLCILALGGLSLCLLWPRHGRPGDLELDQSFEYPPELEASAPVDLPQCPVDSPEIDRREEFLAKLPDLSIFNAAPPLRTGPADGSQRKFSHSKCLGDMLDVRGAKDRVCSFTDVCYDLHEADFVFYAPESPMPTLFDHRGGRQFSFRQRTEDVTEDYVFLNYPEHMGKLAEVAERWRPNMVTSLSKPVSWSPQVRQGPIPAEHVRLEGVHALSAPHRDPLNLGHVAWEDGFPLLFAMVELGVYSPCLSIIRTHGCEVFEGNSANRTTCERFEQAFLRPLAGMCPGGDRFLTLSALRERHQGSGLVCFDTLVAGSSYSAFDDERRNIGKSPWYSMYRQLILAWHGVNPQQRPVTQQILLVNKIGRRNILNFAELGSAITARYSGRARVCQTSYISLTIAEQLALLSKTTVAVSPCGGLSLILPFLPEGAYVILMNYMLRFSAFLDKFKSRGHGECSGCAYAMDFEYNNRVRQLNFLYYQTFRDSDFENSAPGRHTSVRVSPARLATLIDAALADMEG